MKSVDAAQQQSQSSCNARRTAFVLPGGGSLGAVQVGMLSALHAAGIQPDMVVGTSIGGFNGSFVAADPSTAHDRLADVWLSLKRRDVMQLSPTSLVLGTIGRRDSLLSNSRLRAFLQATLQFERIEHAKIPFVATATDVDTGEAVAMTHGPALSALLATSAIPGFLPPIYRDGRTLIDGGVSTAWPVEIAVQAGATHIYVLETANSSTAVRRRGAFAMFERGVDLISDNVVALQRQRIAGTAGIELFEIPAPPSHVSLLDLTTTQELIAAAKTSTTAWLEQQFSVRVNEARASSHEQLPLVHCDAFQKTSQLQPTSH